MNANASPVLGIFEKKIQLEVPLFQRQYVWNQQHQWEPLWEDLERKFTEYLQGRTQGPVHFLGAIVLDQKETPTTHVERRQIIDGQQRLITLQIFLAALRDFCAGSGIPELAGECEAFLLNKGMMANPETDRFKVWPTQADQQQFKDVVSASSRQAIEELYPRNRRKYARRDDPRPRMVEAYLFFFDQISRYFGQGSGLPRLGDKVEVAFTALKNALCVVVIDLSAGDDAQVIFETLNARGEPLLPADLLRNFIFQRAKREGFDQEDLYRKYWLPFDDDFWRHGVRQGQLVRPRSDLFFQHFLASRQTFDIAAKHLYVEYKHWIEHDHPFQSVTDELATIARQRDDFQRLVQPCKDDQLAPFARFLEAFDIGTAHPLLLHWLDASPGAIELTACVTSLESFLLRRAVCEMDSRSYASFFLSITRLLRRDGTNPARLDEALAADWPSDEDFGNAWMTKNAYRALNNPKIVYIFRRLDDAYLSPKQEPLSIVGPLTVEHLMPQQWETHWPLPNGDRGLTLQEIWQLPSDDPRVIATQTRNDAVQKYGNLTILTQALNSSVSNDAWNKKRSAILNASLLPLNLQLRKYGTWDENSIEDRGRRLLEKALALWPACKIAARRSAP